MGDLRERLATLYLDREYDGESTLQQSHPEVRSACYDSADAALAVFADWLRDEAAAVLAQPDLAWRPQIAEALADRARALTHSDTTEQP